MTIEIWLAFVVTSAVVLVIPGPTILTVIGYSVTHGARANLPLILGVALGDATAVAASLFGLGALLAASAFWFTVVKWLGGSYLVFLGVKALRAGVSGTGEANARVVPSSRFRVFASTYVVTALNPKSIVFFVAFMPQFIDRSADLSEQMMTLATTFVVMAAINATLYTLFAASARGFLTSPRAQRRFNLAGGSILTAAGVWGLLAKRSA